MKGERVQEFLRRAVKEGRAPRLKEHDALALMFPSIYFFSGNMEKNRYRNVVLNDATAVVLAKTAPDDEEYIHASRVNDNEFIITQAPMENTCLDFWRMVWQENIAIIICLTKESADYYPTVPGKKVKFGSHSRFVIENKNEKRKEKKPTDWVLTHLNLVHKENSVKGERRLVHLHYQTSPEEGLPKDTILDFVDTAWEHHKIIESAGKKPGPILVHCTSGTKRSGTFVALMMMIRILVATNCLDVFGISCRVREDRYGTLRSGQHYGFLYLALIDYAHRHKLLDRNSLEIKSFLAGMKAPISGEPN